MGAGCLEPTEEEEHWTELVGESNSCLYQSPLLSLSTFNPYIG